MGDIDFGLTGEPMAIEASSAATTPAEDRYFSLVRKFPLRPIRSGQEHDRAIAVVDSLSDRRRELATEERDYLIVLALLIEQYEDAIYSEPSTEE
jgi:HTH-type transcriptional regulator / antitoxin HigA